VKQVSVKTGVFSPHLTPDSVQSYVYLDSLQDTPNQPTFYS